MCFILVIFYRFRRLLGWKDSNLRITISKTVALPLGDIPIKIKYLYYIVERISSFYLMKYMIKSTIYYKINK